MGVEAVPWVPTAALATLAALILLWAVRGASQRRWRATSCLPVAALGIGYALLVREVVVALLPLRLEARIGAAVGLLFPLGFVMRMPFPTGLRAVPPWFRHGPPLFCRLNQVASVAGSIAAVVLEMLYGSSGVMKAGSARYLAAAQASLPLFRASSTARA